MKTAIIYFNQIALDSKGAKPQSLKAEVMIKD